MIKNRKTFFWVGVFLLAVIVHLFGIIIGNAFLVSVAVPVTFLSLVLMYVFLAKKVEVYPLIHLILMAVAEILLLFKDVFFVHALIISIIAQLILVKLIISYKHVKYLNAVVYFLLTSLGYIVIYIYMINIDTRDFVLLYGLVNSLVVSLGMANYLRKMYWANYLLFLGVAFWVLNNAMLSLNIFNINSNVFVVVTNAITHFCICLSFIVRVNKLPNKG